MRRGFIEDVEISSTAKTALPIGNEIFIDSYFHVSFAQLLETAEPKEFVTGPTFFFWYHRDQLLRRMKKRKRGSINCGVNPGQGQRSDRNEINDRRSFSYLELHTSIDPSNTCTACADFVIFLKRHHPEIRTIDRID